MVAAEAGTYLVQSGFEEECMLNTSYQRLASIIVEMLEELSAQVIKRNVQLTAQAFPHFEEQQGQETEKKVA